MKKVFIDTNIMMDFLLEREPWVYQTASLLSKSQRQEITVYCCSLSFSTAIYMMHKYKYSREEIITKLKGIRQFLDIVNVGAEIIDNMLNSKFKDLEDSIQYYSAVTCSADVIVTRNIKDFVLSDIPIMTTEEFLQQY